METQVVSSTIARQIDEHMLRSGIPNRGWYVGITSDIEERLFGFHRVSRQNNWWIHRCCITADAARALEAAYHKAGCKGSTGGGDAACVHIYAYAITNTTLE